MTSYRPASRSRFVLAIAIGSALATFSCMSEDEGGGPDLDAVEDVTGGGAESTQVIIDWNALTNTVAFDEDQFLTFKGARAYAMVHLAQHDALNGIREDFEQYAFFGEDHGASSIAAAAQAAHDVLLDQYPDRQPDIAALLANHLAQEPDATRKNKGVALGQASAAAILAERVGDGFDFQGSYEFQSGPGQYQTTPPHNGFVLQPGFAMARPFAMTSPSQFRPPPPPDLASSEYAAAFNEVKEDGRVDSTTRTPDETGYAVWWMEFVDGSINRLSRELLPSKNLDMREAARFFAHANMTLFDAYIASWDSKYFHNHWRPYTSIREAENDGNDATSPDPTWEPLRVTPPFPEYASAHSVACNAMFEHLKRHLGTFNFTMSTTTAPPDMPTRSFGSFPEAGAECADSRVKLGFHYRYATDEGIQQGQALASYVFSNFLKPE